MKNSVFAVFIFFIAFLSCRGNDEEIQQIDQIIHLYIDSAGRDMLNAEIPGSYVQTAINDAFGLTDYAPVSFSLLQDRDSAKFIEYVAVARRIAVDSSSNLKIYQSKLALLLTRQVNDSTRKTISDTMVIQYRSTPQIFEVDKIWYNGVLNFSKADGTANTVRIYK